eukprot:m.77270 g.77270  ORF g.77270 m.77270 type:complete len:156 (+) comp24995_c2_seq2:1496-1963(+)
MPGGGAALKPVAHTMSPSLNTLASDISNDDDLRTHHLNSSANNTATPNIVTTTSFTTVNTNDTTEHSTNGDTAHNNKLESRLAFLIPGELDEISDDDDEDTNNHVDPVNPGSESLPLTSPYQHLPLSVSNHAPTHHTPSIAVIVDSGVLSDISDD